ncbi:MAG TPA: hypothetical protein PLB74_01785 [Candidatus Paceibacterota bacterium]|nr:hypothetical protein [Candidatus Paceibacterota bacterium]
MEQKDTAIKNIRRDTLLRRILWRINEERNKRIRKELFLALTGMVIGLVLLPLSLKLSYNNFVETGFVYYLTTIINNYELWGSFFNDFIIVLLESLPIFGFLLILVNLLVIVISLRYIFKNASHFSFKFLFSRLNQQL